MEIQYDEYTKGDAKKYITDKILYSKSDKLLGFKPKDLGYIDLRNPMLVVDRRNLRQVE